MEIGVQLYTLRDFCQNTEDFAATLTRVADMGYTTVQVSGTCDYDGQWLKEQLDKNGLKCVLTHIPFDTIVGDTENLCKKHDIFDCKNIGLGCYPFEEGGNGDMAENYAGFVKAMKPAIKTMQENGKYFMYHNHCAEFVRFGSELLLERLCRDFSPEEMGITMDTFWVQVGGGDPAQWLEKLSGRVPVIHLKDYQFNSHAKRHHDHIASIGEGVLNFDRIFEKAESAGTQYMLVELDTCHGEDPFACVQRSYDYLKSCGF